MIAIRYNHLCAHEIHNKLFQGFIRTQKVNKCWRKENNQWILKDDPFIDDWTEQDYQDLIAHLRCIIATKGLVYAAFSGKQLKGFVAVAANLFGDTQTYLDMTELYVSQDMRRCGIGSALFAFAKEWAKQNGAKKLYISAHSAFETQEFYRKMGCVEAVFYHQKHIQTEPYDCQLECVL